MAAWHETSGADTEYLPTDRPSAVSETAGPSHGCASAHAGNATKAWPARSSAPESIRSMPLLARSSHGARAAEETYPGRVLDLSSLDLEEIANALADQTGYEHHWLISPDTGEIAFWTADTGIDGQTPVTSTSWTWSSSSRCRPGSGTRTWPTSPMG